MNIFITGVSSGLGKELSAHYIKLGHNVFGLSLTDLKNESDIEKLLNSSDNFYFYRGSVNNDEDVKSAFENAQMKMNNIDVLINNAGFKVFKLPDEMTEEDYKEVIRTNLLSPILICRKFVQYFLEQKHGHIINIASNAGMISYPEGTAYCSSKAGLIAYSLSLAKYLKDKNVAVNVISPPTFSTEDYRKYYPDVNHKKLLKSEQVIKVIDYLIFNKKFITGKNFPMFRFKSFVKFVFLKRLEFLDYLFQFRLK